MDSNCWIFWKILAFIYELIFEISCWFRWLVWISTFYICYFLARLLVSPSVVFYSIFGYASLYHKEENAPSTRRSKRQFASKYEAYDRRLMLLSAYMLFEHMAPFFSLRCLGNSYFWFPFGGHLFNENILPSLLWVLDKKPPWPPPGYLSYIFGIFFFWGYFFISYPFGTDGFFEKVNFVR